MDGQRLSTGFMASVLHRFCFLAAARHLHRRVVYISFLVGGRSTFVCLAFELEDTGRKNDGIYRVAIECVLKNARFVLRFAFGLQKHLQW